MFKNEADFEELIRRFNIDHEPNPAHRENLRRRLLSIFNETAQQSQKGTTPIGVLRRKFMKSPITKFATAAVIIAAIMLGMHALIGSGTSITMAQVRQAMENIDWMQIVSRAEKGESVWLSFASKLEILVNSNGRIVYSDFKTRKKLIWNPGSKDIYESSIDENHHRGQFLGGTSVPFELFNKMFSFLHEHGYKVTKKLGTYQDQKVEVWAASRVKEKADSTRTETITVYIDIEKKLPVAWKEGLKGPDGNIQLLRGGEFKYPETGPADIYEAGAPRSAKIKPSPKP